MAGVGIRSALARAAEGSVRHLPILLLGSLACGAIAETVRLLGSALLFGLTSDEQPVPILVWLLLFLGGNALNLASFLPVLALLIPWLTRACDARRPATAGHALLRLAAAAVVFFCLLLLARLLGFGFDYLIGRALSIPFLFGLQSDVVLRLLQEGTWMALLHVAILLPLLALALPTLLRLLGGTANTELAMVRTRQWLWVVGLLAIASAFPVLVGTLLPSENAPADAFGTTRAVLASIHALAWVLAATATWYLLRRQPPSVGSHP